MIKLKKTAKIEYNKASSIDVSSLEKMSLFVLTGENLENKALPSDFSFPVIASDKTIINNIGTIPKIEFVDSIKILKGFKAKTVDGPVYKEVLYFFIISSSKLFHSIAFCILVGIFKLYFFIISNCFSAYLNAASLSIKALSSLRPSDSLYASSRKANSSLIASLF